MKNQFRKVENPWRFSVGSFDLLQVKRTNENFTEILRNFEKFAEPVQSHLFPDY